MPKGFLADAVWQKICVFVLALPPRTGFVHSLLSEVIVLQGTWQVLCYWWELHGCLYEAEVQCSHFTSTASLRIHWSRLLESTASFTSVPAKLINIVKELLEGKSTISVHGEQCRDTGGSPWSFSLEGSKLAQYIAWRCTLGLLGICTVCRKPWWSLWQIFEKVLLLS